MENIAKKRTERSEVKNPRNFTQIVEMQERPKSGDGKSSNKLTNDNMMNGPETARDINKQIEKIKF